MKELNNEKGVNMKINKLFWIVMIILLFITISCAEPNMPRGSRNTIEDDILIYLRIGQPEITTSLLTLMFGALELPPRVIQEINLRVEQNLESMLIKQIPFYKKYYTHEDILELIRLFNSPIGQKFLRLSPIIANEASGVMEEFFEAIVEDVMNSLTPRERRELGWW